MTRPFQNGDFIYESNESIRRTYNNANGVGGIPKRKRVKLTKKQTDALSYYFSINAMPQLNDRVIIGTEVGINQKTVQIWFQNQRAKIKKFERERYESASPYFLEGGFRRRDLPNLDVCNQPDARFSLSLHNSSFPMIQPRGQDSMDYENQTINDNISHTSFNNMPGINNNYIIPPWKNHPESQNSNVIESRHSNNEYVTFKQTENNRGYPKIPDEDEPDFFNY
ncbi:LIM homeobox transcription factor 1-beta.1 [Cucumispora dikerogammari]|nr:LIM homeobox transcription factor 1-beta.1 [Cucumispora dikerogammari]